MTRYFLTTFAACKIYFIPQEWFVLNNSRMARVVLILKHFFCSFISKRFMVIVHEYFYSITKKVLVKARANTCHSQDLSYICFVNPQIVFVSVCYLLSLCFVFCWFHISLTKRLHCFLYLRHERSSNFRKVSFVHLWKYFCGNGTWIEFELKLNMNLFRQRYQKGPKPNWVNCLNFFVVGGNKRSYHQPAWKA